MDWGTPIISPQSELFHLTEDTGHVTDVRKVGRVDVEELRAFAEEDAWIIEHDFCSGA